MLDNVRIVLVNPSHPGNIGATARAMKTMGLSELYLLNPKTFPDPKATARASGALDILEQAQVVNHLSDAVAGCEWIIGTSARNRHLSKPMTNPRRCAAHITRQPQNRFALLFGRERTGLTNEELSACHQHLMIASNPDFSSLNLGSAVQIVAYELRMASLSTEEITPTDAPRQLAPADQLMGFYQHLEKILRDIEFLDPKQPKQLMQRLQRLFNRALLDTREINILRGILSHIERASS